MGRCNPKTNTCTRTPWWREAMGINWYGQGGGVPAITSAIIQDSADDELDVVFNQSVTATNSGFTVVTDGASAITISSLISGSGTNTLKFQLSRALEGDETLYFVYNGSGDLSAGGVLLDAFEEPVTNNVVLMFNGVSQYGDLGDILDSLFAAVDVYFELEIKLDKIGSGARRIIPKFDIPTGAGLHLFLDGTHLPVFTYQTNSTNRRTVSGTVAVQNGDVLTLKYDGSVDTGNGLDRVTFEINGTPTGKTLTNSNGTLPASIPDLADHLGFADIVDENGLRNGVAMFRGNAFDYIVRSVGPVDEINIPDLTTGTDTSGNGRDMTRKTDVKLLTYTLRNNRNVSTGIGYTSPNDWQGRPRVVELTDGTWIMTFIEGTEHTSNGTQNLNIAFSENKGMPWLPKNTFTDGSSISFFPATNDENIADSNLILCPNGDLIIIAHKRSATSPFPGWITLIQTRSTDGGKTWSAWLDVGSQFEGDDDKKWACYDYTIVGSDIYIGVSRHNGDINVEAKCMLYKSTDNGINWTKVSDMCALADRMWESGVEYLGGTNMLTVIRGFGGTTLVKTSTDLGVNWSNLPNIVLPDSKMLAQPRLKKFDNEDRIYVSGRIFTSPGGIQRNGFLYSDDDGTSWTLSDFTSVATTDDGGYADLIKRHDGIIIMMAYSGELGVDGYLREYVIIGS